MKKIIIQLAREFWLPCAISIAWTFYSFFVQSSGNVDASKVVNFAFVTFFGISFWFSQWNRVKKQMRVDEGLTGIEVKLGEMLDSLDEKTSNLVSHITGGDSFCLLNQS